MNVALAQGRPNTLGGLATVNEGVLGWGTLHKKEGLNSRVVDIPIAVSARFKTRIWSGKRAV
jgi:hypothetical protein